MNFRNTAIATTLLLLTLAGCTVNPATGKREFSPFMTPSQELALGKQEHPKITSQFGGVYDDPELAGYLATVGASLAANSELPDLDFTFTLLNHKIVNAFALPGGYVYMSRGLLVLFNDEAEMASVLGHEIGHVTARHSASRYNRSVFAGLGSAIVGIATGSGELAQLASQGSQLYLLSYSRGQELQADELGIRYLDRIGYDPYGAARMLSALDGQTKLDAALSGRTANTTPGWARTHPYTADRITAALKRVRDMGIAENNGRPRNRDRFLDAIDGMIYGDDPAQGIIDGRTFSHPILKLRFEAPDGFSLQNTAVAVFASGPDDTRVMFSGGAVSPGTDTGSLLHQAWAEILGKDQGPVLQNVQRLDVNGMEAYTGVTQLSGNNNTTLDIRVVAIRYAADRLYHFTFLTRSGATEKMSEALRQMTHSFQKLSDREASAIKPLRLVVMTVRAGDTLSGFARKMAFKDHQMERFLVLNGLTETTILQPGDRVKIVIAE